jgi:hypothetical protein
MAIDDFEGFFTARARALLDQIASASGKAIDDLDLTDAADTEGLEAADDTDVRSSADEVDGATGQRS